MNRRELIATATAVTGGALTLPTGASAAAKASGRLRLGMIGVGMRGRVLLRELVRRDDVEVVGLCDIEAYTLNEALTQFTEAGRPTPRLYTGSNEAWREMLASADLDGVIIATPWELHAPMAIGAMRARVAVACEVVAGITMDDHWRVLRTQQETGSGGRASGG